MKETTHPGEAPGRELKIVGALTASLYAVTGLFYRKGPQSHARSAKEIFAWLIVSSLLVLFWKGYRYVNDSSGVSLQLVVCFGALFCFLACLIYPFHSTDVFGYINRGWQQVHYHQNPYVYVTGNIPNWRQDPMIWDHWIYNPTPYGFLFSWLTRTFCWIGNGNWALTLGLFKAVNALAYGASAWLIWAGTRRLGNVKPIVTLYVFMWNPLILMHEIANGHNDILTGGLVLLAMYLGIAGAGLWIIPVLVLATFLKYSPAILIPFALVFVVKKQGWATALLSCLIGAVLAIVIAAPYLPEWRSFRVEDIAANATLIDNSLHSFLIHIFENAARLMPVLVQFHGRANWLIRNSLRFGFAVFLIWQFIRFTRIPKDGPASLLIRKSALIMFVLICVVSSKFNAWYLGIVFPVTLLLEPRDWLRRLVVLITSAQLFSLTFFKQAYILNFFAMMLVPGLVVRHWVKRENEDERGRIVHH